MRKRVKPLPEDPAYPPGRLGLALRTYAAYQPRTTPLYRDAIARQAAAWDAFDHLLKDIGSSR